MLARRRRRRQEKNKQKSLEAAARELVEQELEDWKARVAEAKKETETKRVHYRHQEEELRRLYGEACRQLDKRRSTLLATTSLIPYTQTIQTASNFRVPAALLTLQARLCLHVHCLCIHEELLLKTKEQGWDTIAWMEDVSRQLRLLTQKQILLLQLKMQEKVSLLQEIDEEVEIPESVQHSLRQHAVPESEEKGTAAANEPGVQDTPQQQPAYPSPSLERTPSKEESFLEFLQRYEQRKVHQQKADQMRLAEFRSRGNSPAALGPENPYTTRRAGAGKKLKNFASKIFQGGSEHSAVGGMDESLHLDDIHGNHTSTTSNGAPGTIKEESTSSLASEGNTPNGRQSWIPFASQRSGPAVLVSHRSDSNLDKGWSLGSSLRGLRKRGLRKPLGIDMETQNEAGEGSGSINGDEEKSEASDPNLDQATKEIAEEDSLAEATNGDGGDLVDAPTNGNALSDRNSRVQPTSTSPLKNKLKAPVTHHFSESARW